MTNINIIKYSLRSFIDPFPHVDKNTLVVFDIDYTLFRSTTLLGTPEWFFHLVQQEMLKGESIQNSFTKWYPIWIRAQKFNEIVLMDENIPSLLEKIKREAIGYIILTARHPNTESITHTQLRKLNLNVEGSFSINVNYYSSFKYSTLYKNNILFSHDLNKKSLVFAKWIQQLREQHGERHPIKKIIFIDDLEKNVVSMSRVLKDTNVGYVGIHYSAGDAYKARFNPDLAEYQAKILMREYSYEKTRQLLRLSEDLREGF